MGMWEGLSPSKAKGFHHYLLCTPKLFYTSRGRPLLGGPGPAPSPSWGTHSLVADI